MSLREIIDRFYDSSIAFACFNASMFHIERTNAFSFTLPYYNTRSNHSRLPSHPCALVTTSRMLARCAVPNESTSHPPPVPLRVPAAALSAYSGPIEKIPLKSPSAHFFG
jgi:hypothetical protein